MGAVASSAIVVASLVVTGIVIGVVHNRWHHAHRSDPILAGAATVAFPAEVGATRLQNAAVFSWDSLFAGKRLKEENLRLSAQIASLQQENESLHSRAAEADRLRIALGFTKRQKMPTIAAEVIGWLPTAGVDTIIVARGTRDGIRMGSIARAPSGLVGQVISAGPLSSEILLLTDIASGVGALVMRGGKVLGVGIVQGTGRGQPLDLLNLRSEVDIKPGDQIVSSGFGGVFPPDIPIGTVASVAEDHARFLKSAKISPTAPLPGDLRELFLLQGQDNATTDAGGDLDSEDALPIGLRRPAPGADTSARHSAASSAEAGGHPARGISRR